MEINRTTTVPDGTDNRTINVLNGKLKIVVWDFLTKADACFLMASKEHEANFFWRVKPDFKSEKTFDSFVKKYNGYMRYSFGFSNWRGFIGIIAPTP